MKQLEYEYRVLVRIGFSRPEIAHLVALSEDSCDFRRKSASVFGGFLYGMMELLDMGETKRELVEWMFDHYDLQTLCEIASAEGSRVTNGDGIWLHPALMQIFRNVIEEYQRIAY